MFPFSACDSFFFSFGVIRSKRVANILRHKYAIQVPPPPARCWRSRCIYIVYGKYTVFWGDLCTVEISNEQTRIEFVYHWFFEFQANWSRHMWSVQLRLCSNLDFLNLFLVWNNAIINFLKVVFINGKSSGPKIIVAFTFEKQNI